MVCESISTATTYETEACQETFKTLGGPLNCDSETVLYLLKCKVYGEVFYFGKTKIGSRVQGLWFAAGSKFWSTANDWKELLFVVNG